MRIEAFGEFNLGLTLLYLCAHGGHGIMLFTEKVVHDKVIEKAVDD